MSEARIEALERAVERMLEAGGASVTVQDPRVSSVQNWILSGVGAGIVAALGWGALSINRLNLTMERVVTQNEAVMAMLGDHSDRLKELERRRGP